MFPPSNFEKRQFGLSSHLENQIKSVVASLGYSVERPKELAGLVKKLSDHFIAQSFEPTPWHLAETQAAYLAYFLPIGFARAAAVKREGERLDFFKNLKGFIDFGSGPGTVSLVVEALFNSGTAVEISQPAIHLHKKFSQKSLKWQPTWSSKVPPNTLGVFSYVLNELPQPPAWLFDCEALMILEPSTHKDFQRFSDLRSSLIERGFFVWAPCPHQLTCPLSGGRDWCHDRIDFSPPAWWESLESNLPFKNKTVTFSYLLARKSKPEFAASEGHQYIRTVGDRLDEKGKTRQLVCRTSEREFLSWLSREGEAPHIPRGELLEMGNDFKKAGQEIRGANLSLATALARKN